MERACITEMTVFFLWTKELLLLFATQRMAESIVRNQYDSGSFSYWLSYSHTRLRHRGRHLSLMLCE